MPTLAFHTVDVFTTQAFTGNPLAIVVKADNLTDRQMQTLAREFNLPETIFIQSATDNANTAKVRIFTPATELPFAGHPTIGCAIYLAELEYGNGTDFHTKLILEEVAGLVPVTVERIGDKITAEFTAPVVPTPAKKIDANDTLTFDAATAAQALGISIADVGTTHAQPMSHAGGPTFLFVPVNNVAVITQVKALEPLSTQLSHAYGATGIYVYYLDENTNEIDARMFAPAAGIPEDPATGSATALLASQLHCAQQLSEGNNHFVLRQGVDMGRPSGLTMNIQLVNNVIISVKVSGSSTPVSSGNIRIP